MKEYKISEIKKFCAVKFGETCITDAMAHQDGDSSLPIRISLMFFLIETESRRILVDVGCDTMPGFELNRFRLPTEVLARGGITPDMITDIILTHSHHDHADSIRHYKGAAIYIHESEREKLHAYIPDGAKVKTFGDRMSLDGIIDVVHCGGHTVGSSVVEFDYRGKRQVICGDECYVRDCLEKLIVTGCSQSILNSMAFLQKYRDSAKYTAHLPHDPDILPGTNGIVEL